MDKKFAIFDMDGTLIDSMRYWGDLGREFLASKGITEDVEEVLKKVETMTMAESAALFIETFGLEETAKQAALEMNEMMENHYKKDIPLKRGIKEYLENLRSRGVKMCVASATDGKLVSDCLKRLEIADMFSFLLSCETLGVGKSRPDIYIEAAEKMGADISETAVYEDALYAVKTAAGAGFYVVGVYDDYEKGNWDEIVKISDEKVENWEDFI